MNSRTVWRNPRTRSDSEKSIFVSCPLHRRERLEVPTENAIEVRRVEPRLLDLAEDGAVIVPAAVARGIAVRPVASVETARRPERAQRTVPQRLVQVRAGEIDEDVVAAPGVLPERAVPGDPGVRVDDLQPGEPLRQAPEVAAVRAGAEVDQHRLAALLAERRHVFERRDRVPVPERMRLHPDPAGPAEPSLRLLDRRLRPRIEE